MNSILKMTFSEFSIWLSSKSIEEKKFFNELLLSELTILNRALWSDENTSEADKINALKWSNELAHRILNIMFDLNCGLGSDSVDSLAGYLNDYKKESKELAEYLPTAINGAIDRYNRITIEK